MTYFLVEIHLLIINAITEYTIAAVIKYKNIVSDTMSTIIYLSDTSIPYILLFRLAVFKSFINFRNTSFVVGILK